MRSHFFLPLPPLHEFDVSLPSLALFFLGANYCQLPTAEDTSCNMFAQVWCVGRSERANQASGGGRIASSYAGLLVHEMKRPGPCGQSVVQGGKTKIAGLRLSNTTNLFAFFLVLLLALTHVASERRGRSPLRPVMRPGGLYLLQSHSPRAEHARKKGK